MSDRLQTIINKKCWGKKKHTHTQGQEMKQNMANKEQERKIKQEVNKI